MTYNDVDYVVVTSYNSSIGLVQADRNLSAYHYGAPNSTESEYGVDMRGEVMLLSRNVRIVGNDSQAWGCTILTSDFVEMTG